MEQSRMTIQTPGDAELRARRAPLQYRPRHGANSVALDLQRGKAPGERSP
jgi:hypothetical protein